MNYFFFTLLIITAELSAMTVQEFGDLTVTYLTDKSPENLRNLVAAYRSIDPRTQQGAREVLSNLLGDDFTAIQSSFPLTQPAAAVSAALPAQPNLDEFRRLITQYNREGGAVINTIVDLYKQTTDPAMREAVDRELQKTLRDYSLIKIVFDEIKQPPAPARPVQKLAPPAQKPVAVRPEARRPEVLQPAVPAQKGTEAEIARLHTQIHQLYKELENYHANLSQCKAHSESLQKLLADQISMTPAEFAASGAKTFAAQLTECQATLAKAQGELATSQQILQAQNKAIQEVTAVMQEQNAFVVETEKRIATVQKQIHADTERAKKQTAQIKDLTQGVNLINQLIQSEKSGKPS